MVVMSIIIIIIIGKWKDEHKNILCEIFYVVTVRVSVKILKDQKVWDDTGMMEIRVVCFLFV